MEESSQDSLDENVLAVISLEVTTSSDVLPRLKREEEDEDQMFEVIVSASIQKSSKPDCAITLDVWDTALDSREPCYHWDAFARTNFCIDRILDGETKQIWMAAKHYYFHYASFDSPSDYRDFPRTKLVTIPAKNKGKLEIRHQMPWSRVLYTEKGRRKTEDEIEPGETWRVRVMTESRGRILGQLQLEGGWWCWGDVDGNLRDKLISPWSPDTADSRRRPTAKEISEGAVVAEGGRLRFKWSNTSAYFKTG